MKQVPDPGQGSKFNRAHTGNPTQKLVSVAENHEEHLRNAYPSLRPELDRLQSARVPAAFLTTPGRITGVQLARLGVEGICPHCGALNESPNPDCSNHPENSGGGNSWLLAA